MKLSSLIIRMAVVACAVGIATPPHAAAQVSPSDFEALKKMVEQLSEKVQKLEQTHDQDQKTHEQDQQAIQKLERQLGETQVLATNAAQKAEAAQVQPVHAMPAGPPASHDLTLAGDAEVLFGRVHGQHGAFGLADYAPIFLYRAGDNVLFEAGFDFTLSNGAGPNPNTSAGTSFNFDLSFATLDYVVNDYVTLVAGNMLLPLGTYSERSAGWLNKIPDNPLPRGVLPGTGIGAQLRGALPVGNTGQMLTYSVYGVNGPSSTDGTGNASSLDLGGNVGFLNNSRYQGTTTFANVGNLNGDPSGGARIGWFFPLKAHYDLELGVSGQSGEWDNAGDLWSTFVLDAAVHVSPYVEVKGEYVRTWVDTADLGTIRPHGWWIQAAYKLAGLNLDFPMVNNIELVGRYDTLNDSLSPHTRTDRYTAGFIYYLSNTLMLEGDYEWLTASGPGSSATPANEIICQLSYGF
ncbi:exported hypothetical protein [Verrucomicrobia bacterium]|nr:exported hypothetical protein [Verrucomicrobiota bacterium]